jgi:lipopolysaccharide transport system ATP-binding protein
MAAVQKLCQQCIWVDKGNIQGMGTTSHIVDSYLQQYQAVGTTGEMDLRNWSDRYGNGEVRILSARLMNGQERVSTTMYRSQPMIVEFTLESESLHRLHLSAAICSISGVRVIHLSHYDTPGLVPGTLRGRYLVRFVIDNLPLYAGNYNIILAVQTENLQALDVVNNILPFVVEDSIDTARPYRTVSKHGYCWTSNSWTIKTVSK